MSRLVLINGAPGSGKSTLADALAHQTPNAVAIDIDAIKHTLPGWPKDPLASGLEARVIALNLIREHLVAGRDVFVGQYLARTDFIEQLGDAARASDACFCELLLTLPVSDLAERLARRQAEPTRPEHSINNELVDPGQASALTSSLKPVRAARPATITIDARGDLPSVLSRAATLIAKFPCAK